ncbi:MAG: hypothetical protein ABIG98_03315 [Chloroflexota bacterium]
MPSPTLVLFPPVTVDLEGKTDASGVLLEEVVVASSDGRAQMTLKKGTLVLDEQGQPAKSISCVLYVPAESRDGVVVGLAYEFRWFQGASEDFQGASEKEEPKIDPAAKIIIKYDPPPANPWIDPNRPDVAGWWAEGEKWVKRPLTQPLDLTTRTITTWQGKGCPILVVIFWYLDIVPPIS